jgi:hypothetical protein
LERGKRDEASWPGDSWNHELVEVVKDCARQELSERTAVALIGAPKGSQVATSVPLVDDGGGIAEAYQEEIEDEPS